jgi:hypothetical protein
MSQLHMQQHQGLAAGGHDAAYAAAASAAEQQVSSGHDAGGNAAAAGILANDAHAAGAATGPVPVQHAHPLGLDSCFGCSVTVQELEDHVKWTECSKDTLDLDKDDIGFYIPIGSGSQATVRHYVPSAALGAV